MHNHGIFYQANLATIEGPEDKRWEKLTSKDDLAAFLQQDSELIYQGVDFEQGLSRKELPTLKEWFRVEKFTHADFSNNRLGAIGLGDLAYSIKTNQQITHLNLSSTREHDGETIGTYVDIDTNTTRTYTEKFTKYLKSMVVEHLIFADNDIGDLGAIAFAKNIPATLRTLDLHNNEIGDDGAIALSRNFRNLECLDLNSNQLTKIGILALAASVPGSNIRQINVHSNLLAVEGEEETGIWESAATRITASRSKLIQDPAKRLDEKAVDERVMDLKVDVYNEIRLQHEENEEPFNQDETLQQITDNTPQFIEQAKKQLIVEALDKQIEEAARKHFEEATNKLSCSAIEILRKACEDNRQRLNRHKSTGKPTIAPLVSSDDLMKGIDAEVDEILAEMQAGDRLRSWVGQGALNGNSQPQTQADGLNAQATSSNSRQLGNVLTHSVSKQTLSGPGSQVSKSTEADDSEIAHWVTLQPTHRKEQSTLTFFGLSSRVSPSPVTADNRANRSKQASPAPANMHDIRVNKVSPAPLDTIRIIGHGASTAFADGDDANNSDCGCKCTLM